MKNSTRSNQAHHHGQGQNVHGQVAGPGIPALQKSTRVCKPRSEDTYSNEMHGCKNAGLEPDRQPPRRGTKNAKNERKPNKAAIRALRAVLKPRSALQDAIDGAGSRLDDHQSLAALGPSPGGEAKGLQELMRWQFRKIQQLYNQYAEQGDVVKQVSRRLIEGINKYNLVLLFWVATHANLRRIQDIIMDEALALYIRSADAYDYILGESLPAQLRSAAAESVARNKYFSGTNSTAREDFDFVLSQLQETTDGMPTGLAGLDDALGGGVSGLTILGANEGDGKTSLLLNMTVSALQADEKLDCLFFTIDQPKKTTLERLYCLVTGCDKRTLKLPEKMRPPEVNRKIRDGVAELRDSLLPRMRLVEKSNLSVHEAVSADLFIEYYQQLRHKTQATHGMLVIDMFQSLDRFPDDVTIDNDKDDYRLEVIRNFMQGTISQSRPDGFPVIVTSEVRKVDRNELTSNDLRGSARLGSVPINILLLWPPTNTEQHADVVPRELRVAKSRPGDKTILQVQFHHKICRFTEMPTVASAAGRQIEDRGNIRSRGLDRENAI